MSDDHKSHATTDHAVSVEAVYGPPPQAYDEYLDWLTPTVLAVCTCGWTFSTKDRATVRPTVDCHTDAHRTREATSHD